MTMNEQKPPPDDEGPFFITPEIKAELEAAGYTFEPPSHARTQSITDLYGWQEGEPFWDAVAHTELRSRLQEQSVSAADAEASKPHSATTQEGDKLSVRRQRKEQQP